MKIDQQFLNFNPLNVELNLICHLLALLGAHHIFHISRIRVKQVAHTHTHTQNYAHTDQVQIP